MNSLESYGVKKQFPLDTIIFEEGDPSDNMYIVVSGKIEIFKTVIQKAVHVLHVVEKNEYFGEMSLITGEKRSASAKSVDNTEVIQIDKEGLNKLLTNEPEFGLNLMGQMAERLQKTTENLIYSELEMALSQHKPARFDNSFAGKFIFEITGIFNLEKKKDVMGIANDLKWPNDVDVIASFYKPDLQDSLLYIVATDNMNALLAVTSRFGNIVQWKYTPVLTTDTEVLTV